MVYGQEQQEQQFITKLNTSDVLFGRGSGPNDHEGNVWFRQLVAERKPEYMATNHRMTKAKIAREIVDAVLAKNGRFLRKMEASDAQRAGLPEGVDAWVCVDDDTIMEKAKQALRQNTSKAKTTGGAAGGATASPITSSKAKLAPGSSVSCSSNSTNQSNRSHSTAATGAQRNHQHQQVQQPPLGPDIYEDFEPIPITSSAANVGGGGNSYNQQQHQQQATTVDPVSLQPSGRGNYYVVSPQTTAPDIVSNQQQQGLHVPSMAALGGGAGAALSASDESYGVQQQQQQMTPSQQTQYLSHLASGPPPVVPWGSSSGDYNTHQQQDAPDVAQQQQHHYQDHSQQQQQQNHSLQQHQQQNRYNQQHHHPHSDHHHHHQREARESLTIKEVFRLGDDNNRRGSTDTMNMSDLMDSFRAAKLGTDGDGTEDDMPDPETAKKLMASTDTMGTIEQYTGGGTSYAEMSLATMNSSTFSFMKGDDSIDGGAKLDASSPTNQQANSSSSSSGTNTASLAGRNIAVPTRPALASSVASTSTSTIGVHSTDSSSARVGGGLRDSVGSVKSIHSDASISLSDLGPTAALNRRKSAGVTSSLRGVSEEHEAAFREEETQFSTTELDVDPLPLTAQTSGMSFGGVSTTDAMGNSSLSMLKGMLMSTDDMGAFQDDQQQFPKEQNS